LGIVQLCVQLEGFVLQPALALLSCPWGLAGRGEDSAEISWPSPTHALSGSRRGPGWDAGCAGPRGGRAGGSSQALPSPSPKPGHIQKPQRRGQRTALPRSSRARHPPHPSLRATWAGLCAAQLFPSNRPWPPALDGRSQTSTRGEAADAGDRPSLPTPSRAAASFWPAPHPRALSPGAAAPLCPPQKTKTETTSTTRNYWPFYFDQLQQLYIP